MSWGAADVGSVASSPDASIQPPWLNVARGAAMHSESAPTSGDSVSARGGSPERDDQVLPSSVVSTDTTDGLFGTAARFNVTNEALETPEERTFVLVNGVATVVAMNRAEALERGLTVLDTEA